MLKFFVEDHPKIAEVYKILKACDLPARKKGVADEDEICFFYNEKEKSIKYNAHKIIKEDVPVFVKNSPFLVCVGKKWSKRGLINVVEGYTRFFERGLPVICFDYMTEEQIIDIAQRCIVLPWGGFPEKKKNQQDLLIWLMWVSDVFSKKFNIKKF